jgi:cell division protein FtsW
VSATRATRLYDPTIIFLAGALMTLGVVMVYSASVTVQGAQFTWQTWWKSPLKQCAFALAGFLVMVIAAHVDYRIFAWARPRAGWRAGLLYVLAAALLIAVLVPGIGRDVLGARRAICVPGLGFGFQPSELGKVVLVIWLAALLTRPGNVPGRGNLDLRERKPGGLHSAAGARDFRTGFLPAVLSSAVFIGLTAKEDFGTAALMGVVMVFLLLASGARWMHIGLLGVLGVLAGVGLVIIEPYRMERIRTFTSHQPDPAGAGYQIHQALLAIGSGGWWGRGLGQGIQKYGYLPQDNNDFILAIICEELGVAGGLVVVALFLLLLWQGWRIAAEAPDPFGKRLALGLTLMLCLQAAFNVAVVTKSVPTKGISLPFVSAGGSGVVFLGLAAGLLAAVGRRYEEPAP